MLNAAYCKEDEPKKAVFLVVRVIKWDVGVGVMVHKGRQNAMKSRKKCPKKLVEKHASATF